MHTTRRWAASKKHRPCDMLLIARIELQVCEPQVLLVLLAERDLPFQARAQFLPLGDVLMGGHAAAVRHRIDRIGNDPAIGELLDRWCPRRRRLQRRSRMYSSGFRKHLEAQIQPVPDQFADGGSGLYLLGREPIDFGVSLVAEHDFTLAVEDDESQRQVVDGVLEQPGRINRFRIVGLPDKIRHLAFPCADVAALRTMRPALEPASW